MHRRTSAIPSILIGLSLLGGLAGSVHAEAPYFYDDLYEVSFYDPNFQPMFRPTGYLAFLVQGWTEADRPGESIGDQELVGEYRLIWSIGLDEAYSSLLLEGKASQKDDVVADDYFLSLEYVYRGLKAPLWLYAGTRFVKDADAEFYAGLETMAFKLSDLVKSTPESVPLAFKGYAEVHYDPEDDNNPTLRLMVLAMNPIGTLGPVSTALPIDMTVAEGETASWVFSPHLDVRVLKGLLAIDIVSGYSVEIKDNGEQQASIGVRVAFGPPGGD